MARKIKESVDKIRKECDNIEEQIEPKVRKGTIFGDPVAILE